MNWFAWIIVGILILLVLDGYRKGLIKKLVSMAALVVVLILVSVAAPYVGDFLQSTPLYQTLKESCTEIFTEGDTEEKRAAQTEVIESTSLPDYLKELLKENNNNEVYEILEVTGFADYAGSYLAKMILNAAAYLITFLIVSVVMAVVVFSLDLISRLPVISGVNKLAGAALGGIQGLLLLWIFFLVLTVFCNTETGKSLLAMVLENPILSWLYTNNYFMQFVTTLIMK